MRGLVPPGASGQQGTNDPPEHKESTGTEQVIACPECDLLHRYRSPGQGEKACCLRCGTVLYRASVLQPQHMLALTVTALLTFAIANSFPLLQLQVQGNSATATLAGSTLALWRDGRQLVALMVFATTWLFPLLDLLLTGVILGLVLAGGEPSSWRRHSLLPLLLRLVQTLRPWGMIEVLMLGVTVSLIKLSHMAHILPGAALWALVVLTLLLVLLLSCDLRPLWNAVSLPPENHREVPSGGQPEGEGGQIMTGTGWNTDGQ